MSGTSFTGLWRGGENDLGLLLQLDPEDCRPSSLANRVESALKGAEFEELKSSIQAVGRNTVPILVISRNDAHGQWYETVYGHRRREACLELKIPVFARVLNQLDDADIFATQVIENQNRSPLSAWEQGRKYREALDRGLCNSLRELAERIGKDVAEISRAISVYQLPGEVVQAFGDPTLIKSHWVDRLNRVLKSNHDAVFNCAERLGQQPTGEKATNVFKALVRSVENLNTGASDASVEVARKRTELPLKIGGKRVGGLEFDEQGLVQLRLEVALTAGACTLLHGLLESALADVLRDMRADGSGKEATL